jgi:integrase
MTANRTVAMLGSFFGYCERGGLVDSSPVRRIQKYPEAGRERFLTPDEWTRLGDALVKAERDGIPAAPARRRTKGGKHRPKNADKPRPADPFGVAALRMLALTGCRLNEALSVRWVDVDLDRGILTLPDSKTGKSVRLLNPATVELLTALPRFAGNPHVFPGKRRGTHLATVRRLWLAVCATADLEGLRIHDLRHSVASMAAGAGESLLVIARMLGHKQMATTMRYSHWADDPLRRAVTETGQRIDAAMKGTATPVTPLKRGA